jgi:L-lactate dehydrogenase complex protein LldG
MNAREQILASVRTALGRAPGTAVPPPPPLPPLPEPVDDGRDRRLQRFADRLAAVGGIAERAPDAGGMPQAVLAALAAHGARTVLLSDAAPVLALRPQLEQAGCRCLLPDADRALLLAADAGVSAAQWGIAATGTIVLDAGIECSRQASLLPPLHIALLPADRVLPTLGELLAALRRPLAHAVTLVTGPSRTADIELQLVVGVHGPRALRVVLI